MSTYSESSSFKLLIRALLMAFALSTFGLVAGCDNQGPAEEAGEALDDSVEEAGDSIEDATE